MAGRKPSHNRRGEPHLFASLIRGFAALVVGRPWLMLLAMAVGGGVALYLVTFLKFDTRFYPALLRLIDGPGDER